MRMLHFPAFCLFSVFILIKGTCNVGASPSDNIDPAYVSYSFGVVPQFEQRKIFQIWRPILLELERRTGFHFELKGSSKIPEFEESFMSGRFDFAYMNPYHLMKASNSQGYVPLIRDGAKVLRGVLVVRNDSDIKSIFDLQGKTIAFPSPNALGSSLLMRAELRREFGIDFVPKYVQTHSSVYLHVLKNTVNAGGGVIQTLESQKLAIKNGLKILYTTKSIVPHPITAHPRVTVEHQNRVKSELLSMAEDMRGKKLFEKIPIDKAIAASMSDYENIKEWELEKFYVP